MSLRQVKGQDKAVKFIKNLLECRRLAGAYLFVGPEGVGKNFTAVQIAKALNCAQERPDSCDCCPSCLKIDSRQHPDIHIIDAGDSDLKIEYIRQLQKDISLRPYEARKKVFVIRNAHNLNAAASNALLKTLEEPAANSIIILVTEKPFLLFKTIISRCQMVKFQALARQELKKILLDDFSLDAASAHFLAYFSEGRFGRALNLKDSLALPQKNKVIDEFMGRGSDLSKTRQEIRQSLNILATWFRDIYIMKIGMPYEQLINIDRKTELLKAKDDFTFDKLDEIIKGISNSLLYLDQNINTKLLLSNLTLTCRQ